MTKFYYGMNDIVQTGDILVDVEITGSGAEPKPVAMPAEEEAEAPKVRNVKVLATPAVGYLWVWQGGEGRVLIRGYSVPSVF